MSPRNTPTARHGPGTAENSGDDGAHGRRGPDGGPDGAHGPLSPDSGEDGAHGPLSPDSGEDGAHGPVPPTGGVNGDFAGVWAEGVMRFKAARMWVARNYPYYARTLFACPVEFTLKADTLAVNGYWRMRANPLFTAAHTVEQVAASMIHELNHLVRDHAGRSIRAGIPDAGLDLWNIATDFEVNDDLRDDHLDLPEGVLYPEDYGLEPGRLAEQYYQDMLDFASEMADDMAERTCEHDHTADPDHDGGDGGDQGTGPGAARREQLRRQAAQDVLDHAENCGEWAVPKGLRQWALASAEPKADWRRLLASELRKGIHRRPGTGDATWSRTPRRPDDGPVLRPGTARPTADIAVVVDTSGSMREEDHAVAVAEVHAILRTAVPGEAITVYSADERAIAAQTVIQARQIALVGGRGTDMGQAICDADAARPRPAVIVVITDGYTPWPAERPPNATAAVIAVLTRSGQAIHVPRWITAIEALAPGQ